MSKIFNPKLIRGERYFYLTVPSKVRIYDISVISRPVSGSDLINNSQMMIYALAGNRTKLERVANVVRGIIDFVYKIHPMKAPSAVFENHYLFCEYECDVMNIKVGHKNAHYVDKNFYVGKNASCIAKIVKHLILLVFKFVKKFI